MQFLNKQFMKHRLLCAAALGAVLTVGGCSGGNGGTNLNGAGTSGGQITFVALNRELMRADADGSNVRKLTSTGMAQYATLSQNGRKIAYQSPAPDEILDVATPENKIFAMNSDGSGKKKLTNGPRDASPVINSDGSQIAFLRDTREVNTRSDIFIISTNGNGLRRLTQDNRQKSSLSLGPGNKLAFTALLSNPLNGLLTGGLFVLDANAGSVAANNEQQIVNDPNLGPAAFMPDGRIVFLAPDAATGRKIDIIDADGTDRRMLIAGPNLPPGGISRISVNPDGSRLVYAVMINNDYTIWTQPISGGAATRLDMPSVVGAFSPSWGASVQLQ